MEDGEKIGCEFFLWTCLPFVENQDRSTVGIDKVFDEFETEPGKAISVADDNREFISTQKPVQNGVKSFPFEVETAADVLDDFRFGELCPHPNDLTGEVVFLFLGGDSTVSDDSASALPSGVRIDIDESLPGFVPNTSDPPFVCVLPDGVRVEPEKLDRFPHSNVHE